MLEKNWSRIETVDRNSEFSTPERVAQLNARWREQHTLRVLGMAILEEFPGRIVVTSSFGAESAVLLHLVSRVYKAVPVIFLETRKHFAETYAYRDELVRTFGLREVRIVQPDPVKLKELDSDGLLHKSDPDTCCNIRKVNPMNVALKGFDAWITGRKRYQSSEREHLPIFEEDQTSKIKINPLANWSVSDVKTYFENYDLPKHPLVSKGYPSIGCEVCTTKVNPGEDERSGRWRESQKTECGIHITKDGKILRVNAHTDDKPESKPSTNSK